MAIFSNLMKWFYEQLSSPVFSATVAGIITYCMMYLESKISKKEIHRRTYTKNIILVGTIVGTIVYILTSYTLNPKINKVVEEAGKSIGGAAKEAVNTIHYDSSDIFLGDPRF
jgi:hypothetical protein